MCSMENEVKVMDRGGKCLVALAAVLSGNFQRLFLSGNFELVCFLSFNTVYRMSLSFLVE